MRARLFVGFVVLAAVSVPIQAGGVGQRGTATVTIAAAGDIARANAPGTPQQQTAALITGTIQPSKVLALGDTQYEHGEYTQYTKSYDPSWGAFKSITAPVVGNHEYETAGADGYFRYFATQLAQYQSSASDPTNGAYSFDIGAWHVVGLNSNCAVISCSAQINWLKQDLQADSHLCELVMYHHAGRKSLAKAANAQGVDLILAGHKHTYERWDRVFGLNVRQFTVGTGGKSAGTPSSSADAGVQAYGVLRLDLSGSGYTWSFLDVARRVRDSGSGSCHS
ncbi:MAG: metallophosphoesterase [Actinomycetota bacterium]|nr:metallophosphoesterase [Actinomycetota bacterium]MDH5224920.1 metallophosphoesterase [Actinomycetota bacterium]MDH5314755.1 metallophosphoesterase [Actinomycetota bacterium]